MQKVAIFSDGSSKGTSDGPGGYGTIVRYLGEDGKIISETEYTEGFKITTNNRMELCGVICGLESLKEPCDVSIYSDSKYVVDAFVKGWIDKWQTNNWTSSNRTPVKNIDLWKRLLDAKKHHTCTFLWVKGHSGMQENERCDYLAQSSSNGVIFERQENGKLKEKSIEQGIKDSNFERSFELFSHRYIMKDGEPVPAPGEDYDKAMEALSTFRKDLFSKNFIQLFNSIGITTGIKKESEDDTKTITTDSETIPEIIVSTF